MSNIDYRRFVNVNIVHSSVPSAIATRDTTVCFVATASIDSVVENEAAALALLPSEGESEAKEYIHAYFANGGRKLHLKSCSAAANDIVTAIQALPTEEIVIAYPGQTANLNTAMKTLNSTATTALGFYGIKRKLAVVRTSASVVLADETPGVIAKYSTKYELQGTIAAYLSKIDINRQDAVQDYDFTIEVTTDTSTPAVNKAEDATDEVVSAVMAANENVDVFIAGQYRNIGGNTKDGKDLVNEYMLIVLQQTLTERIMEVLAEKIKGETGVSAIHTTVAEELNRYVTCGYIATDKVYTGETLAYSYNGQNYVLLEKNTPLLTGYAILVVPYSALTAEDKAAHKAPSIYVALADSYGIRKVDLSGIVY